MSVQGSDRAQAIVRNIEARLSQLEQQTDEYRRSAEWKEVLDYVARFPSRSLGNNLLIFWQRPSATLCFGFRQWHEYGRHVSKGEKGIAILAPIVVKDRDSQDPDARKLVGFKTVWVWDIAQTTVFDETLAAKLEMPAHYSLDLEAPEFERAVRRAVRSRGIELIDEVPMSNQMFGLASKQGDGYKIELAEHIRTTGEKAQTLLHEWAHVELHMRNPPKERDRRIFEWEAESVAYVVMSHFNLPASGFKYLAQWEIAPGALTERISTIGRAAQAMIERVESQDGIRPLQPEGVSAWESSPPMVSVLAQSSSPDTK